MAKKHVMMLFFFFLTAYSWIVSITALSQQNKYIYKAHLRAKIAHGVAKGERRARERLAQPRPVCPHCSRPPILCVCNVLPSDKISTATKILILQHPNEFRKRNLSTVPLIRLVLQNVQVLVGYSFHQDLKDLAPIQQALHAGIQPLLLYPGEDATSLDDTS